MADEYAAFRDDRNNFQQVLLSLVNELDEANAEVERIKERLKTAENVVKDLVENRIPTATEGMEGKFDLPDGRTLTVKEEIRASIAGEKRIPAIRWLDEHGYGHIVKRQVVFEFPRGQTEEYTKFVEAVNQLQLGNLVMKENNTVHPMTLVSWVKDAMGEGENLPVDIFGIYRQRTAKVKE